MGVGKGEECLGALDALGGLAGGGGGLFDGQVVAEVFAEGASSRSACLMRHMAFHLLGD